MRANDIGINTKDHMGRKKLDQERTAQILEAFGKCVVRNGLDNSGISAVARKAGLSRTLVHHFVGTRDNLILMLVEDVLRRHEEEIAEFWRWIDKGVGVEDILAEELERPVKESATEKALYSILNSSRYQYPEIDNVYQTIMEGWAAAIGKALYRSGHGLNESDCRGAAITLVCLFTGWEMLWDVPEFTSGRKELKKQFKRVVQSLPVR